MTHIELTKAQARKINVLKRIPDYIEEIERYDAGMGHVVVIFLTDQHEQIEHMVYPNGNDTHRQIWV